ncbi:MAG TPA: hypothetical protein VM639_19395 [Dongiaceae bacterium]|nr:hypothetical protein [Dongiaceae bacterium]
MSVLVCTALTAGSAAWGGEIEIGASLATARQQLQQVESKIAVDTDEGLWHILVAQQSNRMVNLLFEQDRLRYISYDFHLGSYQPHPNSFAHCDASFNAAVTQLSASYGTGSYNRVMTWPEREITMTWRGDRYYAVARELSDLNGCLLVKAMIFDGDEAAFKIFDKRLKQP